MDGGFFLVLNLVSQFGVIHLELAFEFLAAPAGMKLLVSVKPVVPLEENIADQDAAQVGNVRDSRSAAGNRREEGKNSHEEHEPLDFDGEQKIEIYQPLGVKKTIGEQQPVDRAGSSDRHGQRVHPNDVGTEPGADAGDKIIGEKAFRSPDSFQVVAEHVERKHIDEDVEESVVQEHVAEELPEHELMSDAPWNQPEV